ncbi:MAG: diaminopimelate decarboxylase, partial [Gemmatimonadetes bacterium]|nr:diaminopimelate decarboxylase [Gemmatimonadota bacterium]
MGTIDRGRVILGGLVAGVVLNVGEYVLNGLLLRERWDAAMTELIRPALYQAYHAIEAVLDPPDGARAGPADVVGPVCETGDFLARDRPMPPLA